MVTISKALSAGQAQTYHKQEFTAAGQNYYRQGGAAEGEWQGKLAAKFGLDGVPVDAEHFARLTEGKNPQTEEQLIRSKASFEYKNADGTVTKTVEHRAGWDATFSAPKSVSLAALVGGDERVREAHRQAVTAALTELERYTQARIGGNNPAETTGRFIAAKFEHDTARPVDGYAAPQLHTHAVVFNMTERDNGKMRALQPQSLFDTQSYATAVYQSELTARLRGMGYELTTGKSGAPEIQGFTQEYLDASSLRSQQIREQLEKKGLQGPAAAQIAAHATRDGKLLLSPEEVLAAHRQLAREHGNQAEKIVAVARERGRSAERTPGKQMDREARAREAVGYAKEHIFEREAVADRRAILRDALRRGMGQTTPSEVKAEFERRRELGEFRQAGSRTYDTERRYTTPEVLAAERANVGIMKAGQNAVEPMMSADAARQQAAAKSILNATQQAVTEEVLTSRDRVHGLQGLAGTGKTTTLRAIREGAERAGYAVEGLAPTGKAASQLRDAGISAGTLQAFITRSSRGQADPNDRHLYMLDESSLASTRQMRDFLRKLGPNDRVLVIGDTGQHQGVDAGRPFEQMQQAGMQTAQLSEIVRQRNNPELKQAVEHLAKGETKEGVKLLSEQGRIEEIADAKERVAAIAKSYTAKPESTIIISPDNASRRELNEAVRRELLASGKLEADGKEIQTLVPRGDMSGADRAWAARYQQGDVVRYAKGSSALGIERGSYATVTGVNAHKNEVTVRRADGESATYDPTRLRGVSIYREVSREFATGDRLQFTAPNRQFGIANRDLGTVTELQADRISVKLDGKDAVVTFDPRLQRHIDHGYAVTSHSSQGLTVNRVLVNIDTTQGQNLINARLAYVAVSRAAEDARIYVNRAEGLDKKLAAEVTKTAAIEFGPSTGTGTPVAVGPKRRVAAPQAPSPTVELRHAARMLGTEEARIGVNLLEQQGRLTVQSDRSARFSRIVEDYANRREGAVAVVGNAQERDELNRLIRAELRQTKAISPDSRTLTVLVQKAANPKTAASFDVGDRIEFSTGSRERGIEPHSRVIVRAVNAERNQITVEKQDGELKTYNPAKLKASPQARIYGEETRQIAIGDRIRVNVDHRPENIRAGDLAQVEAIRGIGALQVRMQDGRVLELNPALAQHIEHGYAVTSVRPGSVNRLLVALDNPGQIEAGSPLLKAISRAEDTRFYSRDRFAFYDPKTPGEIEQFLARAPEVAPVAKRPAARLPERVQDPNGSVKPHAKQEPEKAVPESEQKARYAPLQKALISAQAEGFGWVATTGTIHTYRHEETGRNLHVDSVSGQFYNQQRTPISRESALAHALPQTREFSSPGSEKAPHLAQKSNRDQGFGLGF